MPETKIRPLRDTENIVLKSISLYTGARAINGAASLALLSLLTTALSVEAYGAYSLLFTFSVSLATISYQWIAVSVFRFNNPQSSQKAALQNEALRLYLFVCLAVIFLAPIVFFVSLPDLISLPVAFIMVSLTILAGLVDLHLNFATSSAQPLKYVIMTCGRAVFALALVTLTLAAGYHEIGVLLAVTLSYFIAASFGLFSLRQPMRARDPELRKRIVRYGLPISVSSVAIIIIDFSDRYMLGMLTDLHEVGMYSAAYNLSQQTTGALLSVIFVTVFPHISGAYEKGNMDQLERYTGKLLVGLLSLGGAILTCFVWYSSNLTGLILGQGVAADAGLLMPLISLAVVLGVLKSSAFDVPAKLEQKSRYLLVVSMIMAGINVVLNLVFIPIHGATGAAYATLLTFGAGMLISLIRYRNFWRISRLASGLLKVTAALVVMNVFICGLGLISSAPWIVGMPTALGLYAVLLYMFNPRISTKDISA